MRNDFFLSTIEDRGLVYSVTGVTVFDMRVEKLPL